jgi:DNA-binding CsgD family transcriptional regulator
LFDRALRFAEDGEQRAVALFHKAQLATPFGEGVALGERALRETVDSSLQSRIHRLLGAISYALGDVAQAEYHAREAVRLAEGGPDAEALGLARAELAHWTFCGGGGFREDLFVRAVSLDASPGAASSRSHYAKISLDAGYLERARNQLDDLLAEATARGDLHGVATHRLHLAQLEMWQGNFHRAIEHAEESLFLHEYSDQPSAPRHVKAMSLACLGRMESAREEAEIGLVEATRSENVLLSMYNQHVLGFIELSMGSPSAAHRHLAKAVELHRPRWNREFGDAHYVPDEVEALLALGEMDQAADLVAWMEEVGAATGRTWVLATSGRSRGLLLAAQGRMPEADLAFQRSLVHHRELAMPFELARTLLAHGTLQRRRKQRAMAAETLRQARDVFASLDSPLWAEKAQSELDRIGIRSQAQLVLTPVEEQIALLASQGHNNREIADLLFISRKTVEANLTHIYRKLGIHSRAQLGTALAQTGKGTPTN